MDNLVSEVNPYIAPGAENAVSLDPRGGVVLGWSVVLIGLVPTGVVFGFCFGLSMFVFGRSAMYWGGWSPVGTPSILELAKVAMMFSIVGLFGGLLATPLLYVFNRRAHLNFWSAFGSIATIGTVVFFLIAGFSDPDPSGGLFQLSPVTTIWMMFGCLLWLPSLLAAVTYGLWVHFSAGHQQGRAQAN